MKSFTIRTKGPTSVLVEGDVLVEGTVWTTVYREDDHQRRVVALVPSGDVAETGELPAPK